MAITMIKILLYLPLHVFNLWLSVLSPCWIFKRSYAPSSELVRIQEQAIRNKMRLTAYRIKRK